ncbi:hypothetical protein [Streptomyces shenzhenensis]|uniref:hypothetical protein n=1 Tax=Streptomyces shenzhenensis TaxID=943815 RepID=UPI001F2206DE|nr:hypothetical protein [Streptomyces shenzhenensis]
MPGGTQSRCCHRTRVTENSTHIAFVLEPLHAARGGHLVKAAVGELQDLLTGHCAHSTVHYRNPARPQVTS